MNEPPVIAKPLLDPSGSAVVTAEAQPVDPPVISTIATWIPSADFLADLDSHFEKLP